MRLSPSERLVAIGSLFGGVQALFDGLDDVSRSDVASFMEHSRGLLEEAQGLLGPTCRLPTHTVESWASDVTELRNLALAFEAASWHAASSDDSVNALKIGIGILDLANVARRGRVMLDLFSSHAVSGTGCHVLGRIRPSHRPLTRLSCSVTSTSIGWP